MANLKEFIDKLQKIYDEAKTSGHTRGDYPPNVTFYLDDQRIYDYYEIEINELDEQRAICCGDVIGLNIYFRRKDEKADRT